MSNGQEQDCTYRNERLRLFNNAYASCRGADYMEDHVESKRIFDTNFESMVIRYSGLKEEDRSGALDKIREMARKLGPRASTSNEPGATPLRKVS